MLNRRWAFRSNCKVERVFPDQSSVQAIRQYRENLYNISFSSVPILSSSTLHIAVRHNLLWYLHKIWMVAMQLTTSAHTLNSCTYTKLLLLIDTYCNRSTLACDFVTLHSSNIQHIHQYSYFESSWHTLYLSHNLFVNCTTFYTSIICSPHHSLVCDNSNGSKYYRSR